MIDEVEKFVQNVAKAKHWIAQPDQTFLNTVLEGLQKTREKNGYYLCPCREGWGIRERDRDIICPCEYATEDIREFGQCYCGLFISEEKAAAKGQPEAIPDRRSDDLYPD